MSNIQKHLELIAKEIGLGFTLFNSPISYEEVFKDTGLLPAIARRADQLCSLCLGYGIGISFNEDEKSRLGVRVTFDDVTPNVLRYMCITDVLYELSFTALSPSSVPLDDLMSDY